MYSTKSRGNVFKLNTSEVSCFIAKIDESWLWHIRFCHVNFDNIVKESLTNVVRDLSKIVKPFNTICRECVMGKQARRSYKRKSYMSKRKLDLVHTNLCGPTRTRSFYVERYFIPFVDEFYRMTWINYLKEKSEAFEKFKIFKEKVENE